MPVRALSAPDMAHTVGRRYVIDATRKIHLRPTA